MGEEQPATATAVKTRHARKINGNVEPEKTEVKKAQWEQPSPSEPGQRRKLRNPSEKSDVAGSVNEILGKRFTSEEQRNPSQGTQTKKYKYCRSEYCRQIGQGKPVQPRLTEEWQLTPFHLGTECVAPTPQREGGTGGSRKETPDRCVNS